MGAKLWCALAVCVACAGQASAETTVDGNILTDTTWTAAGSPYVIQKQVVTVRMGSTLTIEPGVEVRFEPERVLTTDPGCAIVAVGTSGNRIVFTSNAVAPEPGDWGKVEVYDSEGSAFERCTFRYAYTGLYVNVSTPTVSGCLFEDCVSGVYCHRASPSIVHSSFTGMTWAGVYCYSRESLPLIDDCNLWGNEWNLYLQFYSGSEPEVTITAENCWWGSSVEADVAASIYDKADNSAVNCVVDYDPWLSAQPVEAVSWGVIKHLFRH